MKRFGKILLVSLLASSMIVTPVFAEPNVSDLEQSKKAAEGEVSSLQQELQGLMEKMNELEANLIEKGQDINEAEEDLAAAEEKEKQQYEDMKLRIKYMYEEGDGSFIESLLSAGSFSELLNKAEYVQNVHSYDRKMLEEYVKTKQQIADLKAQLETEMKDMEAMQTEYKEEQTSLNATLVAKQAEVSDLDVQLQAAAQAAAEAAAERERKEAEEKAKQETEKNTTTNIVISNNSTTVNSNNNSNSNSNSNNNSNANSNSNSSNNNSNNQNNSVVQNTPSTDNCSQNSGSGSAVVSGAQRYLGVPYEWGGTSSSGVDCSGLVYLAHRAAGISVSRQSGSLGSGGKAVSSPLPGDVVCYSGHVGIYVGNGQMIHAPEPGKVVCYTSVDYAPHWYRRYW